MFSYNIRRHKISDATNGVKNDAMRDMDHFIVYDELFIIRWSDIILDYVWRQITCSLFKLSESLQVWMSWILLIRTSLVHHKTTSISLTSVTEYHLIRFELNLSKTICTIWVYINGMEIRKLSTPYMPSEKNARLYVGSFYRLLNVDAPDNFI